MTAGTGSAPPPDDGEIRRLREEVASLQAQLSAAGTVPTRPPASHHRGRSIVATSLIVLSCILAPLAVVSIWASREVSNTDRYVQTVAPLASDSAVQAAVANTITDQINQRLDLSGLTNQVLTALSNNGLSPQAAATLQGLNGPITSGVQSFLHTAVVKVVDSQAFVTAWEIANREAHKQLVALLAGHDGAVNAKNGTVQINLGPFIAQVKEQLIAQGFGFANQIPTINASFTLLESKDITKAQNAYRLLNALGLWLPFVALGFGLAGVYAAKNHRHAVIGLGLGITAAMLVLGAALAVSRPLYLNAVPTNVLPRDAASALFDTLIRFLREALRATALAGIVVAAGAFLTGPSATARRVRNACVRGIGWLRDVAESDGMKTGSVGAWTYAHKRVLHIGAVVLGLAILTLLPHATISGVIAVTVLVLVAVGIIEFLGRPPAATAEIPAGALTATGPDERTSAETTDEGG
jgi:hypothetical protein